MEERESLEELKVKVGDELLYNCGHSDGKVETIVTVTKVTPTGRIRIDWNDCQYDKYGNEMRNGRLGVTSHLSIPTEADYKRIKENKVKKIALYIINRVKTNMDYETALKIIDTFGAEYSCFEGGE